MATDTNRASFVQQEYRYATKRDATVLARNPGARQVELPAQVDEATANRLAQAILDDNKNPMTVQVEIEGLMLLDKFVGGVPSFTLNLKNLDTGSRVFKVIDFDNDFENNTTTMTVRG
jgi:hypothetical protein